MSDKTKNILAWVLTILSALWFISSGAMKFSGMADLLQSFEKWGYSVEFMYFIGVCEILGGVALFISKLRNLAIIGLLIIMMGAMYTHIASDELSQIAGSVIATVFLVSIYFLRKES